MKSSCREASNTVYFQEIIEVVFDFWGGGRFWGDVFFCFAGISWGEHQRNFRDFQEGSKQTFWKLRQQGSTSVHLDKARSFSMDQQVTQDRKTDSSLFKSQRSLKL
jgi:hypothetical protein